jgi:hypothetical protein
MLIIPQCSGQSRLQGLLNKTVRCALRVTPHGLFRAICRRFAGHLLGTVASDRESSGCSHLLLCTAGMATSLLRMLYLIPKLVMWNALALLDLPVRAFQELLKAW